MQQGFGGHSPVPLPGPFIHSKRTTTVNADLNLALIKRLKSGERPVGLDAKGALVFEANVGNKPYILWD